MKRALVWETSHGPKAWCPWQDAEGIGWRDLKGRPVDVTADRATYDARTVYRSQGCIDDRLRRARFWDQQARRLRPSVTT